MERADDLHVLGWLVGVSTTTLYLSENLKGDCEVVDDMRHLDFINRVDMPTLLFGVVLQQAMVTNKDDKGSNQVARSGFLVVLDKP